ncbi:WD repeat-containing protein 87 [Irineochytrium annulatum]|nr:WD repeat-containing protein 87 [Irineochytrium annulatum]
MDSAAGDDAVAGASASGANHDGGLEQETIHVFPWKKVRTVIWPMASRTPGTSQGRRRTPLAITDTAGAAARPGANRLTPKSEEGRGKKGGIPGFEERVGDEFNGVVTVRDDGFGDGGGGGGGGGDDEEDEAARELQLARSINTSSHLIAITIPHGFQSQRTILMPKPSVRSVIYASSTNTDAFAAMDAHGVHIVRGAVRVMNVPTGGDKGIAANSPVAGLSRWIYVKKWRMTIVATLHLELKILGLSMEEISSVSSVKPVLSLEFNEEAEELIAGGVGNIRVWSFSKSSMIGYQFSGPRLIIDDLATEEWVTHTLCYQKTNRLYAACENNVLVYDYITGKRIESLRNVHELSISCMCFYEPFEYLITGSRDASIKVWTRHNYLIFELRDISGAPVTGLVIPNAEGKNPLQPYLISCSVDGTIRMWNLEDGRCIYRLETPQECLGIEWMRRDTFFHHSKDRITVWNLNRYYTTFAFLKSAVIFLRRAELRDHPARIVTGAVDGSLRLISPVTGAVLTTAFPVMKETTLKGVEYDTWRPAPKYSKSGSRLATAASSVNVVEANKVELFIPTEPIFVLLGGTDAGQIVIMYVGEIGGRQEILVQAHTADITGIACYTSLMLLITSASDGTIKLWRIQFTDTRDHPTNTDSFGAQAPVPPVTLVPISNLSTRSTIMLSGCVATSFCMNLTTSTLAVGTDNSQLLTFRISPSGIEAGMRRHAADEDHTRPITSISALEHLGLYATSSTDGTIKIWDAYESNLIREIQFNEPLTSVCFCNHRGDLLVGMTEQVALVRLQDYLPAQYLGILLENPEGWADDILEVPKRFDSSLDFWELYRTGLERVGADLTQWHVTQHIRKISDHDAETKRMLDELERKRDEAEANRRRRKALRDKEMLRLREHILYTIQPGEGSGGHSHYNSSAPSAGGLPLARSYGRPDNPLIKEEKVDGNGTPTESDSPAVDPSTNRLDARTPGYSDDDDRNKDHGSKDHNDHKKRLDNKKMKDMYGMKRPGSNSNDHDDDEDDDDSEEEDAATRLEKLRKYFPQMVEFKQVPGTKSYQDVANERSGNTLKLDKPLLSEKEAAAKAEMERRRQRLLQQQELTAPPPPVKAGTQTRHFVRERMAKLGILPNSIVGAQIQEDKRKKALELAEKMKREKEEREKALAVASTNRFERPKYLLSRRGKKPDNKGKIEEQPEVDIDDEDDGDNDEDKDDEDDEDDENGRPKTSASEEEANAIKARKLAELGSIAAQEASKVRAAREAEEAERRRRLEADERRRLEEEEAERARLAALEAEAAAAAAEAAAEAEEETPEEEESEEESSQTSESPPPDPMTMSQLREMVPNGGQRVKARRHGEDGKKPARSAPAKRKKLQKPVFHPKTPSPVVSLDGSVEEMAAEPVEEPPPPPEPEPVVVEPVFVPEDAEAAMAAKQAWGLLEMAMYNDGAPYDEDNIRPELRGIVSKFWFPGLGGKDVNLSNIIDVLLKLMKKGLWLEKCEASKALLYLYNTFKPDFVDPMSTLIYPQLDLANDDAWQVRAQVCANLAGYGIYHPDIMELLICKLKDESEAVRKAAKKALASFGIDSKSALRGAMIRLNMLPNDFHYTESDWLDILLQRMQDRLAQELLETNEVVVRWRNLVHPSIYGSDFDRPNSAMVTLVFPGITDGKDTKMTSGLRPGGSRMFLSRSIAPLGSRLFGGSRMALGGSSLKINQTAPAAGPGGGNALLTTIGPVQFPGHVSRMASGIRLAVATEFTKYNGPPPSVSSVPSFPSIQINGGTPRETLHEEDENEITISVPV